MRLDEQGHFASEEPSDGRALGSSYTITTIVGRGSTGEVWRGETLTTGEPIAAKLLFDSLTRETDVVARFIRERSLLTRVVHPNVVKVRDLIVEGETLAIVSDLVEGPSLREVIDRNGTIQPRFALELCQQVLDGLSAVHQQALIHRDVKPENILIERSQDGDAIVRIVDFGIAQLAHAESDPRPDEIVGSVEYIAPEQLEGGAASAASDIYSVGVVLYELLCGRTPFASELSVTVMRRQLNEPPRRPEGVPTPLWVVMSQLLAKKPAMRPQSADAAATLLDGVSPCVDGLSALPKAHAENLESLGQGDDTIITTRSAATKDEPAPHPNASKGQRTPVVVGAATAVALALGGVAFALTQLSPAANVVIASAPEHYATPAGYAVRRTTSSEGTILHVNLAVTDAPNSRFQIIEYVPSSFRAPGSRIQADGATVTEARGRVQLSVPAEKRSGRISYRFRLAHTGTSRSFLNQYERARVGMMSRDTTTAHPDALVDLGAPPALSFEAGQRAWLDLSGVTAQSKTYVTQTSPEHQWLNELVWTSSNAGVANVEHVAAVASPGRLASNGAPVVNGVAPGVTRLTASLAGRTVSIDVQITPARERGPRCEPGIAPSTRLAVATLGDSPRIAEGTLFQLANSKFIVLGGAKRSITPDRLCGGASVLHGLTSEGLLGLVGVVGGVEKG